MKIEDLLREAEISMEENNLSNAHQYLITALELENYNKSALLMLSRLLSMILEDKEALVYAEKAYKYYSEDSDVLFVMGYLNQVLEKPKKALIYYEKYFTKTKNYFVYLNAAICYMDMKYYKKAMECINLAIEMEPKYSQAYFEMAECYLQKKEYDEAFKIYEKIKLTDNVEEYYLYMKIALAYYKKNDVEKAVENFNIAINVENIPTIEVYNKYFEMILNEELWNEAELLLINYKNSDFPREDILKMERRLAYTTKNYEREKKVLQQLILVNPNDVGNYLDLIEINNHLENFDEALEIIKKIREKYGKHEELTRIARNIRAKKKRRMKKMEEKR